jgi:quercetin dioxygenase-like cupin family protein
MLIYTRLPFAFHAAKMQEEVHLLAATYWNMHYNKSHYEGDWSVIALRSPEGLLQNIFSVHSAASYTKEYRNTPLFDQCPYITEVLDQLKCEKTMVRLMKLNAGAIIKEHRDHEMCFEAGEARLHIPIQTNDKVAFYIEEEKIPMKKGECWYLNLNLPHRVSNDGNTDRIHLVVDCIVNDWLRNLLTDQNLYKLDRPDIPARQKHSKEDRIRIIESLRILNTQAAIEIANQMEMENE